MNVKRFAIEIPQAALDDLHQRLLRTRWPDPALEDGWNSGTDPRYLDRVASAAVARRISLVSGWVRDGGGGGIYAPARTEANELTEGW